MFTSNISTTASFMTCGMLEVNHRTDTPLGSGLYERWAKGAVELHIELVSYAEVSESVVEFLTDTLECDFPRVYDYEVSEPFGNWFANHIFAFGDAPERDAALDTLYKLIAAFFAQSGEHSAEALFTIIKGHKV